MDKQGKHQKLDRPLKLGPWIERLEKRQKDVAKDANITESYLSQLIANPRQSPSVNVFLRLAAALGLDNPNDLFLDPPDAQLTAQDLAALARLKREWARPASK